MAEDPFLFGPVAAGLVNAAECCGTNSLDAELRYVNVFNSSYGPFAFETQTRAEELAAWIKNGGDAADVVISTDLALSISRDETSHPSYIKYLDLSDGEIREKRFDSSALVTYQSTAPAPRARRSLRAPGTAAKSSASVPRRCRYVDHEEVAYNATDGTLMCTSSYGRDGTGAVVPGETGSDCAPLKYGANRVVLIEAYFSPIEGATFLHNTDGQFYRNAFTLVASFYSACSGCQVPATGGTCCPPRNSNDPFPDLGDGYDAFQGPGELGPWKFTSDEMLADLQTFLRSSPYTDITIRHNMYLDMKRDDSSSAGYVRYLDLLDNTVKEKRFDTSRYVDNEHVRLLPNAEGLECHSAYDAHGDAGCAPLKVGANPAVVLEIFAAPQRGSAYGSQWRRNAITINGTFYERCVGCNSFVPEEPVPLPAPTCDEPELVIAEALPALVDTGSPEAAAPEADRGCGDTFRRQFNWVDESGIGRFGRFDLVPASTVDSITGFLHEGGDPDQIVTRSDLELAVKRDDSSSPTSIRYVDLDDFGKLKEKRFDSAQYVDNERVEFDNVTGTLMCTSSYGQDGTGAIVPGQTGSDCAPLPYGEPVRVVLVSLDFRPQTGATAHGRQWRRNQFTLKGSYYAACVEDAPTQLPMDVFEVTFEGTDCTDPADVRDAAALINSAAQENKGSGSFSITHECAPPGRRRAARWVVVTAAFTAADNTFGDWNTAVAPAVTVVQRFAVQGSAGGGGDGDGVDNWYQYAFIASAAVNVAAAAWFVGRARRTPGNSGPPMLSGEPKAHGSVANPVYSGGDATYSEMGGYLDVSADLSPQ